LTKETSQLEDAKVSAVFDELKPVRPEQMIGSWKGGSFDTGHPVHMQLGDVKWAGKDFRSENDVDPMVVYEDGKRTWSSKFGRARVRSYTPSTNAFTNLA
jgi:hypothetical protein